MELKRDLLKFEKKSVFRIILGLLFLIIAVIWLAEKEINLQMVRPFDWVFFGIFLLNGVVHSVEGFGFSIAQLFGRAFVLIDDSKIAIKTSFFSKEQHIAWQEIKSISNKPVRCQITRNEGTSLTLNLSKLDYLLIKDIKATIEYIAKEKGVEYT